MEKGEQETAGTSRNIVSRDGVRAMQSLYIGESKIGDKIKSPIITKPAEGTPFNIKALSKYEATYKLETFHKNYMIIFNHEDVYGCKKRVGTKKDVAALKKTFVKYGFEIVVHTDLSKAEILEKMKIFEDKNFTDYGCVAIAILTHGGPNGLLRAKDQEYSEMEIMKFFKTHDKPTLVTKPKILLIQACRGENLLPAVVAGRPMSTIHRDQSVNEGTYTIPVEVDTIVVHSTYVGTPSHRLNDGSWFIQTLCDQIEKHSPHNDIESIMTEVKRIIAIDSECKEYSLAADEIVIYKQMPVVTSTLIRKLYFKPKPVCNDGVASTSTIFLDGLILIGPCFVFLFFLFIVLKHCCHYYNAASFHLQ